MPTKKTHIVPRRDQALGGNMARSKDKSSSPDHNRQRNKRHPKQNQALGGNMARSKEKSRSPNNRHPTSKPNGPTTSIYVRRSPLIDKNRQNLKSVRENDDHPKRSLYNDQEDSESDDSDISESTMVSKNETNTRKYKQDGTDLHMRDPLLEHNGNSPDSNNGKNSDDDENSGELGTDNSVNKQTMTVYSTFDSNSMNGLIDDKINFPRVLRPLIINTVRTVMFRRIKFLTNDKLSMDSPIFQELLHHTGFNRNQENAGKYYDALRHIIMRQMNSKRNYCTDQILAKARGRKSFLLLFTNICTNALTLFNYKI